MKGDISRLSHTPGDGRSGVVFQQGRVVTDSDLTEAGLIAAGMADTALLHAFGSGAPAAGGIVDLATSGLRAGWVVADGLAGRVEAAGTPSGLFGLYSVQRDFPQAPAVPTGQAGFYYADVWRRTVDCDEDPSLTDIALGSQETSARQVTVAQIRWAPHAFEEHLGQARHELPCIGTGTITATAVSGDDGPDPCDPCATEVEGELALDNLFVRVEVVHVAGPAHAPTAIEIAWSRENASSRARSDTSDQDFINGAVFEHHSRVSELHMGAFADPAARRRSAFIARLPGSPAPPGDGSGSWQRVRRWDGHARIEVATRVVTPIGDTSTVSLSATGLAITVGLDMVSFTLTLTDRDVLTGDAWGIVVRERGPEAGRVAVVNGGAPIGIRHHYLTLIGIGSGGEIIAPTDAERRRLSAPALTNIPASHVGIEPGTCPKLFGSAANVQNALEALCGIDADDIPFENNCPALWDGAETVQDALDRLCHTDFSPQQGYRTLFDWGVACGLNVELAGKMVRVSPGAFLDRAGRLSSVDGEVLLDLNDSGQITLIPKRVQQSEERCLCVAATEDGTIEWYLVEKSLAFGPPDPGLQQRLDEIAGTEDGDAKGDGLVSRYFGLEKAGKVGAKFRSYGAMRSGGVSSRLHIAKDEIEEAKGAVRTMMKRYESEAGADADFRGGVEADLGLIKGNQPQAEINNKFEDVLGTFFTRIESEKRRAMCAALLTPCPPPLGKRPWLVPIGCVIITIRGELLDVSSACPQCCRKQALTLRTLRYRMSRLGAHAEDLDEYRNTCCYKEQEDKEEEENPFGNWPIYVPGKFEVDDLYRPDRGFPIRGDDGDPMPEWYKPYIDRMSEVEAVGALKGYGVEVVKSFDLDDPEALAELDKLNTLSLEERFEAGTKFKAGDKLALVMRDGKAVGWQVVERGDYIPPYAAAAAVAVSPETVKIMVAEAISGIQGLAPQGLAPGVDLKETRAEIEALAAGLKDERDAVAKELDQLKAARAGLQGEIGTLTQQVTKLGDRQTVLKAEMNETLKSLQETQANAAKLMSELRGAMPVNAATNVDAALGGQLLNENVRTVGELAALSDVQVGEIAKKLGITRAKFDAIRADAKAIVAKGGIG
ncbi:MAG: hypothetical protein V4574_06110 [Pseudomonadota bacterium]